MERVLDGQSSIEHYTYLFYKWKVCVWLVWLNLDLGVQMQEGTLWEQPSSHDAAMKWWGNHVMMHVSNFFPTHLNSRKIIRVHNTGLSCTRQLPDSRPGERCKGDHSIFGMITSNENYYGTRYRSFIVFVFIIGSSIICQIPMIVIVRWSNVES